VWVLVVLLVGVLPFYQCHLLFAREGGRHVLAAGKEVNRFAAAGRLSS
jgi:hypothetical protein